MNDQWTCLPGHAWGVVVSSLTLLTIQYGLYKYQQKVVSSSLPSYIGVTKSRGRKIFGAGQEAEPSWFTHLSDLSLEGKQEKDLKLDLATKGDNHRLTGMSLLQDLEPGFQTKGNFSS